MKKRLNLIKKLLLTLGVISTAALTTTILASCSDNSVSVNEMIEEIKKTDIKSIFNELQTEINKLNFSKLPTEYQSTLKTKATNLLKSKNFTLDDNSLTLIPNDDKGTIRISYNISKDNLKNIEGEETLDGLKTNSILKEELIKEINTIFQNFDNSFSKNKLPSLLENEVKTQIIKLLEEQNFIVKNFKIVSNDNEGEITITYSVSKNNFEISNLSRVIPKFKTINELTNQFKIEIDRKIQEISNNISNKSTILASSELDNVKQKINNFFSTEQFNVTDDDLLVVPNDGNGELIIIYIASKEGVTISNENDPKIISGFKTNESVKNDFQTKIDNKIEEIENSINKASTLPSTEIQNIIGKISNFFETENFYIYDLIINSDNDAGTITIEYVVAKDNIILNNTNNPKIISGLLTSTNSKKPIW
ncbi:lipoprotein 17-related variable surface protein [Mycoplasmoides pirum]|uniref:lipoprotein 17-related variable surface protein n=1 Tax=Mycoplasmoides pirum TaxID=2122 RepID=UPI0004881F27|nr:lipoprotein 17-related variable surface protein [Mycoplasmoides pirum]